MADKITFSKKINDSVQVGDELWYSNITPGFCSIAPLTNTTKTLCDTAGGAWTDPVAGTALSLGTISDKEDRWVKVANAPFTTGSGDFVTNGGFDVGYDAAPNEIINGTFDNDLAPWIVQFPSQGQLLNTTYPSGVISWDSERMYLDNVIYGSGTGAMCFQNVSNLTAGETCRISFDYEIVAGTLKVLIGSAGSGIILPEENFSTVGIHSYTNIVVVPANGSLVLMFSGSDSSPAFAYVDNVKVQEGFPAGWSEGDGWSVANEQAEHTGTVAGFLDGSLTTNFVEGETYRIEMDVISNTGNIILANVGPYTYGSGYDNVIVDIDTSVSPNKGTAEWTQNDINLNKIRIYKGASSDCVIDNVSIIDPSTSENLFFMFRKPVAENVSSLKGYFAEVEFATATNVNTKQELFSVGSEVTISSK